MERNRKKHSPEEDILAWFEFEVKKVPSDNFAKVSALVSRLSVEQVRNLDEKLRQKAERLKNTCAFLSRGNTAGATRVRKEYELTLDLAEKVGKMLSNS